MELIIALIASIAFAFIFRKPLKRFPWIFYTVAIALDAIFISRVLFDYARGIAIVFHPYLMRCLLGFGLIAVVMYIGVFDRNSKARRMLTPVRGELSIVAGLLIGGHAIGYLSTYMARILSGFAGMSAGTIASLLISIVLVILLVVLLVTSFGFVKTHMTAARWKFIQRFSYLFFGLVYVHLATVLITKTTAVGQKAWISMLFYSVVFGLYTILRIRRYVCDKGKAQNPSSIPAETETSAQPDGTM